MAKLVTLNHLKDDELIFFLTKYHFLFIYLFHYYCYYIIHKVLKFHLVIYLFFIWFHINFSLILIRFIASKAI